MTDAEIQVFKHHDKIRSVRKGELMLVCAPIDALNNFAGGTVSIPIGATLRVTANTGSSCISCDVALFGRVIEVGVLPKDFHCLEVSP